MFFLSDITEFKRRKGSKNKIQRLSKHDQVKQGLAISRQAKSTLNTLLGAAREIRYWIGK